jgi:hypothetical protein
MPRFHYHVRQGKFSDVEIEASLEADGSPREEALAVCADLARDIFADLANHSEWRMEVRDEAGKLCFQIRLSCSEPLPVPNSDWVNKAIPMSEQSIYLREEADKCRVHASKMNADTQAELRRIADAYIARAVVIESKESQ